MKTCFIFITLFSLLVRTEGFNLNKLGRRSGYSRNYQQQFDQNDIEEGIRKSKLWYLRNNWLGDEDFDLVGRGGDILMSPVRSSLRRVGARLSITNNLDILRDRLRREMQRSGNKKQTSGSEEGGYLGNIG